MLRSRRATPIQDIVDGATTEDCTDCRQKHRLCISTPEHLDSKCRRERDRELRTIVCRSAGVQQESRIRRLLGLDALDDLGPFALELAGILDRGGLGGAGGSNLGGAVGLEHRHGRCRRRGSRNGLRCRRYRFGRRRRNRGLGRRLGRRNSSAAVPRHATLMRGRSSGGGSRRGSSGSGTRNQRRLLGSSGCGCSRRTRLSSSHTRRHRGVGDHGLQACHALGQGLNGQIGLGTCQARAGELERQAHAARAPHLQRGSVKHRQHAGQVSGSGAARLGQQQVCRRTERRNPPDRGVGADMAAGQRSAAQGPA